MEEQIAAYLSGEMTPKQKVDFFQQISANEDLQKVFTQAQNSWALAGMTCSDPEEAIAYFNDFNRKRRNKKWLTVGIAFSKYAALLIIGALITWIVPGNFRPGPGTTATNSLSVPAGQRALLTLNDGTKVWLNSLSTLTYPGVFTGNSREVSLEGEAYFDVAHNDKKMFIVKTNQFDVKVFGTEFNVTAYSGNSLSEVFLLKGSVEVIPAGNYGTYKMKENEKISFRSNKEITPRIAPDTKNEKTSLQTETGQLPLEKLTPGEKTLYVSQIEDLDYFKWREGLICFKNETVESIIEKLQKFYDIQIIVEKPALLECCYSGKFRTVDGVEQVIKVLQLEQKFTYTRDKERNLITIK